MSLVIAVKKDGVVYFGADTQATYGRGERRSHLNKENLKIKVLPNGIILGRVGSVHSLQHVWAHSEWFTIPEDGVLTKRHVVTEIVPKIYECYRDGDLFEKDGTERPLSTGDAFLLGYRDKLFWINHRLGVVQVEHCVAIGAGSSFVQYGLSHMDMEKPVIKEMKRLLQVGAECAPSVSGPFAFTDTATCKIKIER